MMRTIVMVILMLTSWMGCRPEPQSVVVVAAASNIQFVIRDICTAFKNKTGIGCEIIISSSGKLTAQIDEGAPFDVFLSADMKYPEVLFRNDRTFGSPRIYGYGHLVLWSRQPLKGRVEDILKHPAVEKIAIPNPKTAPYGKAALEYLTGSGLLSEVKTKLVYGESLSQSNQFVQTGAADVGFTSSSTYMALKESDTFNYVTLDLKYHNPIAQGMVTLKSGKNRENADQFQEFLFSHEVSTILKRAGYELP